MTSETKLSKLFHHAALGIIQDTNQRLLITQRPLHKLKGGFWEFPGGKIEQNETPEKALIRELKEELGIEVSDFTKLMQHRHQYENDAYHVLLEVFHILAYEGIVSGVEGQNIAWVKREDLKDYKLLEPNIKILSHFLCSLI
jgi:8-oxo-dGTP diphosphatase